MTFDKFEWRYVVLQAEDVDTDQIIPARYLTATSDTGLSAGLFADWRYDAAGQERPDFVLNRPEAEGAEALVVGRNFGCGSSREHAAWALAEYGFRVIIGTEIADIFRHNALKNGLLTAIVPPSTLACLMAARAGRVGVSLERQIVQLQDSRQVSFDIDPFARHCLLHGVDELGFLLQHAGAVAAFERARAASSGGAGEAAGREPAP